MRQRSTPAVSVVVPTCARTELLRRALASVQAQSFSEWDCWIVNDSPEHADEVQRLLGELDDERFHLLANPGRRGPSASRNAGIESSGGAILAFLDDDDQWLPGKLASHVAEHRRSGSPSVVYSQSVHAWEGGLFRPFRVVPGPPPPDLVEAIRQERFWPGGPPVVTVSRRCLEEVGGFDVELRCREDQDLMLRLAGRYPLLYVPEPTVLVTEHTRARASISFQNLIGGLERLGPSWGVPELRQRQWIRDRVLMYESIGLLDASVWRRVGKLLDYGRLARPEGYGWLRWAWWGVRREPRKLLRLCGLALGGRAFCWLNRAWPFGREADAALASLALTARGPVA